MTVYKNREEIAEKYKWCLGDIVSSLVQWEKLYDESKSEIDCCLKYKGKLNNPEILLECLDLETALSRKLTTLYCYAMLRSDENVANSSNLALKDRVYRLFVTLSSNNSYIVTEISNIDSSVIESLIKDKRFENYDVMLKNIIREKPHILSEAEEKILSETSLFASSFKETFSGLNNADLKFDSFIDEDGNELELTNGNYGVYLQSQSRDIREKAFNSCCKSYKSFINTIVSNYAGSVKKDCFYAKVRNYESALAQSMSSENVNVNAYNKLLHNINANVDSMHRYIKLRKRVLGVDKIHMYDLYTPLVQNAEIKVEYDEAYKLVIEALAPLGKEYTDIIEKAHYSNWIDVYENEGKRSGAYSCGIYGTHPYVLLNYTKTTHDVFTIAHEMGHAMHSYYSNKSQTYRKADYEIFVAEVASTVNEILLLKYLSKTADKGTKKYLLSYLLDTIRTTIFRQTMFAEFEVEAHNMVEKEIPLTKDSLNDMYYKLNVKYYGEEVSDEDIKYEWARIPHFYTSFYVYKYATGLTSAIMIVDKILTDKSYVKKYYEFLKAGCSLPPLDILRLVDVDLESDAPYESVMKLFSDTVSELEELL